MRYIVFFLLGCLIVSGLNAEKSENPMKGSPAAAVRSSKDFEDPPISIGETDLLIENRMRFKSFFSQEIMSFSCSNYTIREIFFPFEHSAALPRRPHCADREYARGH